MIAETQGIFSKSAVKTGAEVFQPVGGAAGEVVNEQQMRLHGTPADYWRAHPASPARQIPAGFQPENLIVGGPSAAPERAYSPPMTGTLEHGMPALIFSLEMSEVRVDGTHAGGRGHASIQPHAAEA